MGKTESKVNELLKLTGLMEALREVPNIADLMKIVAEYDLPAGRRRVLAIKMVPALTLMTIGKKCEIAKVSRRYWYDCEHDPEFQKVCTQAAGRLLGARIPEVTNAFIQDAIMGNSANQVRLLEMVGILKPVESDHKTDKDVNVSVTINFGDLDSDDAGHLDRSASFVLSDTGNGNRTKNRLRDWPISDN